MVLCRKEYGYPYSRTLVRTTDGDGRAWKADR
jgi:hypothetical protein